MQLPPFDYHQPDTLEACLELLAADPEHTAPLAGGTDLLVNMKLGLTRPRRLVSLKRVPGWRELTVTEAGGLRIGAGCTLTELAEHPELATRFPALQQAIRSVGSRHVRNMATIGGNVCLPTRCWYTNQSDQWRECRLPCFKTEGDVCHVLKSSERCHALNSSDSAPALIALNARVTTAALDGGRDIPLAEFYANDGVDYTVLRPGELLTCIDVPPGGERSTFIKVAQRTGLDYAAGTIAAAVEGKRKIRAARLVVGAIGSWPTQLHQAASIVCAQGLTEAGIDAAADAARADLGEVNNLFSPSGYKRRIVRALVRRALEELKKS